MNTSVSLFCMRIVLIVHSLKFNQWKWFGKCIQKDSDFVSYTFARFWCVTLASYCKQGKICWAKLLHFLWFSRVPLQFFHEFKCLSLIINNKQFWPMQCKIISAKTSMRLKPWTFSPANLSTSTVHDSVLWGILSHAYCSSPMNSCMQLMKVCVWLIICITCSPVAKSADDWLWNHNLK